MRSRTGLLLFLTVLTVAGCKKSSADADREESGERPELTAEQRQIAALKAQRMEARPSAAPQLVPLTADDLEQVLVIGPPAKTLGAAELAPGAVQAIARYCYPSNPPQAAAELLAKTLDEAGWTDVAPRPHPSRSEVGLTAQRDGFRLTARVDDGDGGKRCGDGAAFAELTLLRVHHR